MCLVMLCTTLFAGCSLVERDSDRYYNAVISVIKDKNGQKVAEITNRDLISGYHSYGQSLEQYYGYTKKEAVNEINKFLDDHNYKSYYMNVCEDDNGRLRIDVGSWSEFFYIEYMSLEEWAK